MATTAVAAPLKSDLILLTVCKTLSFNFANYTTNATDTRRSASATETDIHNVRGRRREYANVQDAADAANANASTLMLQLQLWGIAANPYFIMLPLMLQLMSLH